MIYCASKVINHASHFLKAPSHRLMGLTVEEYTEIKLGRRPLTDVRLAITQDRILEREEWLLKRPWVIPPMIRSCIMTYLKEEFRLLLKGPTTWSGK